MPATIRARERGGIDGHVRGELDVAIQCDSATIGLEVCAADGDHAVRRSIGAYLETLQEAARAVVHLTDGDVARLLPTCRGVGDDGEGETGRIGPDQGRSEADRSTVHASGVPILSVDGERKWFGQCGLEVNAIRWLFPGKEVKVETRDLATAEPITIRYKDDEILEVTPDTTVGHINNPMWKWSEIPSPDN